MNTEDEYRTRDFRNFLEHKYNGTKNVIVNLKNYEFGREKRDIIPFSISVEKEGRKSTKIGLVRNFYPEVGYKIVVEPKFDIVAEENEYFIILGFVDTFRIRRESSKDVLYAYSAYDYYGHCVASSIESYAFSTSKHIITIKKDEEFCVLDHLHTIVPYGMYSWIDGFDQGFARVRARRMSNIEKESDLKWGIINKEGQVILPLVYDNVLPFYKIGCKSITVIKEGKQSEISFADLKKLTPIVNGKRLPAKEEMARLMFDKPDYDPYDNREWLHRYDGSISDAFEGDSDARWNTD